MVSCGFNNENLIDMKKIALKILQEETDGFESQSRLREDVLDAMVRFKNESEQLTIPDVVECKHDFEPYYNWCSELAGYRCEKCGEEKD